MIDGKFETADWEWLKDNSAKLSRLKKFVVTEDIESVADIPTTTEDSPYFSRSLEELLLAKLERVGDYALQGCEKLESVSLPDATEIGDNAFKDCTSLTSVSLPVATDIGSYAFSGCSSLKSVSLPEATNIGERAFDCCTSLTSVSLPVATDIGLYAFSGCTSLTSVSLPVATDIGWYAFSGCTSLTSVSLPAATDIDVAAFWQCVKLKTLQLGATPPTSVGDGAFENCPAERTLIITDSVGVPLVGPALATAANNYDGKEGAPKDGKWYGWTIEKNPPTMLSVIIEPAGAGTAEITRKDGGTEVSKGDPLTKDEVLVIDAKPIDKKKYQLKAITAKGSDKAKEKEWKVTAAPGEQVVFTVVFEKKPEEEGGNNNNNAPTPVESVLLSQVQLSPNPTDGQVTIDAGTAVARCEVYGSTGVLLQTIEAPESVFTIDLMASPSGVYLVRLVDVNGESRTLRVVKQ